MEVYQMKVSPPVLRLLNRTVEKMVDIFGISRAEAVARINEQWYGQDLSAPDEIIQHEDSYYWALFIYYGGDVSDWRPGADRSQWVRRPRPDRDSGYWTIEA